jgi:TetR/AcrR family transcriptional repressor of nem operon
MCSSSESKGCLFVHTAMELAPHDNEIQGVLQKFMKRMSRAFAVGLESAQEKGEVKADLDVRAAGEFLTGSMWGLAVLARTGFPRATLDQYVDSAMASLVG